MKDTNIAVVECNNCAKEFFTRALHISGDTIVCPHCKHKHMVDTDFGEEGEFWYLTGYNPQ